NVQVPIKEDSKLDIFHNNYSFTKGICEQISEYFIKKYDMPIFIFRLSNIYGPYQDWKINPNLLPQVISQAIINKKIEIWNLDPIRDYIYVDDVVEAIIKALHSDTTGIFNLGTGIGTSVREIITKIANLTNVEVNSLNKPVSGPIRIICDINKIKNELGWRPRIILDEGIKRTVDHYKKIIPFCK
ncbi:MAG: NAD(P)-dependent oxidoreductase, partial [Nanoarchaeota archaeon]